MELFSIEQRINNFLYEYDSLNDLFQEKIDERSKIDCEMNRWYHLLEEFSPKHVTQSHTFMKEGREILQRRRVIKQEHMLLQILRDNLGTQITKIKQTMTKNIDSQNRLIESLKKSSNAILV